MARQSVGEEGARRRRGGQAMGADETTMRVLVLTGARPDIIKSASVMHSREAEGRRTFLVHGGPHDRALPALCRFLEMPPFATVRLGSRGPRLAEWHARQLEAPDPVIARARPDAMVVQGDTTTALAGALLGFHHRVTRRERLDGASLLGISAMAPVLLMGWLVPHLLWLCGDNGSGLLLMLAVVRHGMFGHAAAFHGIASALRLDGERDKAKGVPLILVGFFVSTFASTAGFLAAMGDMPRPRRIQWRKTPRDRDRAPGAPDPATRP